MTKGKKLLQKEKILTDKFICQSQDLLFAGMKTKYFKGKKMVARAGIDKEGNARR